MNRGFVKLSIVMLVALSFGFVASVILNIVQNQRAQQDHKLLQGEITDLRYQVNQDRVALDNAGKPTASPLATPDATPSPSPAASPTPTPGVLDASTKKAIVKTPGNVHQGPDVSSKTLIPYTQLSAGTAVTLGSDKSGKYQQITVNGVTGYILADDLE